MNSFTKRKRYELRFRALVVQLFTVRRMYPRDRYLYRLMDGVPFQDFETALELMEMEFHSENRKE